MVQEKKEYLKISNKTKPCKRRLNIKMMFGTYRIRLDFLELLFDLGHELVVVNVARASPEIERVVLGLDYGGGWLERRENEIDKVAEVRVRGAESARDLVFELALRVDGEDA